MSVSLAHTGGQISPSPEVLVADLQNSSILITGGAGFLGRGILRYLQRNRARSTVTVYSRDEHKHHYLKSLYPSVRTVLGDIRDQSRLEAVMAGHNLVIHAAALKHVPEAERDASEAIGVNVSGSVAVAQAAIRSGVETVVGISTDKAVSPQNTYGATKMLMERLLQEFSRFTPTSFVSVRYGNVVSSQGSVVPLFRRQIRESGVVTITSLDMTRFWISIDDAVRLIDYAASHPARRLAHTFVAACPAMRVIDVAQCVWELEGHSGPVQSRVVGTRPGEKLHEVLIGAHEAPYTVEADEGYYSIPPATAMSGGDGSGTMPYTSSAPRRWLTPSEMASLIIDAEAV